MKMKRLIIITISAFTLMLNINSQNIDDALRYSQVFYYGTARFNSMGGAFTSLGADLSAITLNPAGSGMFRSYEISVTPKLIYNNTSSDFNGTETSDFRYTFGLSQVGIVSNVISKKDATSGLINLNLGYTYTGTNNFNENIRIEGVSDNSSMADYWARIAEGTYYKDLKGSAGIAYDAWVMDTIPGSGAMSYATVFSAYGEDAYSTYGQVIKRTITNEGYGGEHAFSIGANLSNIIYLGASFGIHPIRYTGHYDHLETDDNNVIYDFKNFTYTDHFETTGTGYSGKIGLILRPIKILRLGFAFHAPIIYNLDDYFFDNVRSEFDNFQQYEATNEPLRYSYTLTTPYRILAGASVQLGKLGIITADYEFVDYTKARFSNASDNYGYENENKSIQDILKISQNARLGAEIRLGIMSLRAGYAIYGSAFREGEDNENLMYNIASGGLGFRQNNFYFDFAYNYQWSSQKYYMYDDPPYLQAATISTTRNTLTTTLGIKF